MTTYEAQLAQNDSTDTLALHAQEMRQLGTLRRFKRVCEEQNKFLHDTDKLRLDRAYRSAFLRDISGSNEQSFKTWLPIIVSTLDTLDSIDAQINLRANTGKFNALPQSDAVAPIHRLTADLPVKNSLRGKTFWGLTALLIMVTAIGIFIVLKNSSLADYAKPDQGNEKIQPVAPVLAFKIHGSNTIGEKLAPTLIAEYLRSRGRTVEATISAKPLESTITYRDSGQDTFVKSIELHAHGSSTAFTALEEMRTNIGMSSRMIKDEENNKLLTIYGNMKTEASEHIIAIDGLAIIVHSSNPLNHLTVEQAAKIFSGQIKNWRDLGGPDREIILHARDEKSGTWDSFKSLVLDRYKAKLNDLAIRYESSSELSDKVASEPGAIGAIGLPYVRQSKALAIAETSNTNAYLPSFFSVSTEDYPLSRRLYLYSPYQSANAETRAFLEFVQSDAGQEVVRRTGFIPQLISAEKVDAQAEAPSDYKLLTQQAQRLSFSFRFRTGSNELDSKAVRDFYRLVNYLSKNSGKSVYLLGHTDSQGGASQNLLLSKNRALKVSEQLKLSGISIKQIYAMGSSLPIASNEDEFGRNRNRRVEVWVQ
ncbi:MAG: phosphate ABC transporter substrate-binding/OmpA family protein [Burkholderiales bacterium]|jgi:phosphate transport system substrate-binding protein|nr:phosphate ABC transporter substrate-binding/OmpA family protein [Burkholderiales bacterium]MCA3162371.1 phosphate ABC transporter substrate-binding/OmpA family protein [Burkholderiales bacterium]MCA3163149.1 phosphate ABC transporter substrate-binding/OmpA family protein [Burkholderiales bacterium]MCA3166372.1 phosphate ABC transporter substrate-binding/OmpA family protein [Burkholderiales bacterium]MCA3169344.1 phosphate ABC transporter substrate-binding/OmpA family protein [Burkholderiales